MLKFQIIIYRNYFFYILVGIPSIPFFIIIIIIFASYKSLQGVYGKCLMCYLFGLTMSHIFRTVAVLIENHRFDHQIICKMMGFMMYSSFYFSFYWLIVISFNFWYSFKYLLYI